MVLSCQIPLLIDNLMKILAFLQIPFGGPDRERALYGFLFRFLRFFRLTNSLSLDYNGNY